ncbi:glutamate receptor ionotropic, kainate 2-like isoform X2 [Liolophura sinensis]|uniref:glutamate receptor ionotropic, kainate 2-like isoform X2 n=1 Tax=Liolophura sinensis TaxID=3198878 RepID=UPI00315909B8
MSVKHKKRLVTYFLIGSAIVQLISCLPELIKIGGLFSDNEWDESVQNAFKYAVYRLNHDRTILPKTKVEADIQRVSSNDSFRASKKVCQQIDMGVCALFGPKSSNIASYVNSMSRALKIPHIEARVEPRYLQAPSFSINLYPDPQQLGRAYVDVIKYFGWKQILVLYGDKEGLLKIQTLIRAPFDASVELVVRNVDKFNMRAVLHEAQGKKYRNIIAELSVELTYLLLKMALQEGMIDPYHHYILTNMDSETIDMNDFRHNYVNLTTFRLVDPEAPHTARVLQDMEIYQLQTDLKLLNRTGLISHEAALIFDAVMLFAKGLEFLDRSTRLTKANQSCDEGEPWASGDNLYSFMTKANVKGLTGLLELQQGRRLSYKLDIMELKETGLYKVGKWDMLNGLNFSTDLSFRTAGPFGNRTLKVVSLMPMKSSKEMPYVMLKSPDQPLQGNNKYEGFCIDLLNEIAKIVDFKYEIYLVPDRMYGAIDDATGEWNGLVKELVDNRADMAVAALTISYLREQVIDFTKPFLNLGITILFKVPKREKPGLFSFLNPLAIEIWLYVIAAYLMVSFVIFILARFSPYEWYNPHPCNADTDTVENAFSLSNSFWFTVGTLMQQGSDINPRAVSTRIVGGIWWFFTLIIISSYTANLAAFLTVERMVSPINSADDLAKQTEISYGTLAGGTTWTFFKTSTIEVYQNMWRYMEGKEPSVFTNSYQEGIEKVLKGNYAYLMESTMIDYEIQRNCDLMQVGGLLDSKGYGIGTPMNSPYRDKLSLAILELQEGGKIHKLYNKWWKNAGTCNRDDTKKDSKASALGVENVGGIFVVLLAGLAMAVIVAIMEFVWNSKKNAQEDRQSTCSEMAEELRFAIRCHGSTQKPRFKRHCSKCKTGHGHRHSDAHIDSPNGIIQLREIRKSPLPSMREYEYDYKTEYHQGFHQGEFMHVDYSDTET